jgi:hypothetical protein
MDLKMSLADGVETAKKHLKLMVRKIDSCVEAI